MKQHEDVTPEVSWDEVLDSLGEPGQCGNAPHWASILESHHNQLCLLTHLLDVVADKINDIEERIDKMR